MGRTITEKVNLLSHATSPAEAQAALTAPPSAKPQPKTFNHAIARAALAGSQSLTHSQATTSTGEDPLAAALEKYALAEEKVGEARLAQDQQIQARFLAGWTTTLNTNLMFATRARRNVESARLNLDATKARGKKGATVGLSGEVEEVPQSDEHRAEVEKKEDEFVGVTEEAVGVMKNVSPCSVAFRTGMPRRVLLLILARCSIRPSHFATLPISLLLSSSSTKKPMRF